MRRRTATKKQPTRPGAKSRPPHCANSDVPLSHRQPCGRVCVGSINWTQMSFSHTLRLMPLAGGMAGYPGGGGAAAAAVPGELAVLIDTEPERMRKLEVHSP